ncbi:MAG TPA: hypothetical protein VN203_12255, partial [Candidatus Acidoferrum sp.]|nr:hypothetical protein [Candidatus Acidoferrum sp.]
RGELTVINTDGEVDQTTVAQPEPLEFEVLTCNYTIKGQADLTRLNAQLTAWGFDVTQRFDFEGKVQVNPTDYTITGKATGHSYVLARVKGCGFADNTDVYTQMPISGDSAALQNSQELVLTLTINTHRTKSTTLICKNAPPKPQRPVTIEGFTMEIPAVGLEGGETTYTAVLPDGNIDFKITITPRRAQ